MSDARVGQSTARSRELYERAAASTSPAASARAPARPGRATCRCPCSCAAARARVITDEDGNDLRRLRDGPGPADPRPPAADAVIEAVTRDAARARLALLARARPRGPGRRRPSPRGCRRWSCCASATPAPSACSTPCASRARSPAARRCCASRATTTAGRTRSTGRRHPGPGECGPGRRARRRARLDRDARRRRRDAASSAPGTTSTPLERVFAEHGSEIAAVITEPIIGNCGAIMPGARLPRAHARAGHRARRGADLRRGADRAAGRPRRRAGPVRHRARPDRARQGARRRRSRWPPSAAAREIMEMVIDGRTMHGGTYNSSPLVCAAVIAAAGATGQPGFYDDARGARPAARRRPRGGRRATRGSRPAGAAPARCSSSGSRPSRPPATGRRTTSSAASPFPTLYAELRERGVLIQPPQEGLFFLSGGHTDDDVDRTLEAAADGDAGRRGAARGRRRRPERRACDEAERPRSSHARASWRSPPAAAAAAAASGGGSARARPSTAARCAPASPTTPTTSTPGLSYANEGWEILEATNNGLLTFKKARGGAGAQIVPDIAVGDADGHRRRPHLHVPRAHRRDVLAAGQPRGEAVRHQVLDRAAVPDRLRRRRLLHRHRGANAYAKTRKGGISGIVAERRRAHDHVPPDRSPTARSSTTWRSRSRSRCPRARRRRTSRRSPQWRIATGPYMISSTCPSSRSCIDAQPELPPVDAGLAQRAPGRDRRQDRRHARAGGERDRRRPARLVLRVGAARPADRAQGALPEPGAPLHAQQHHVLRDERAQGAVRQARRAPGGQLRDRPARARQDLRRPGHARPRTSCRPASARPTSRTTSTRTTSPRRKALVQRRAPRAAT